MGRLIAPNRRSRIDALPRRSGGGRGLVVEGRTDPLARTERATLKGGAVEVIRFDLDHFACPQIGVPKRQNHCEDGRADGDPPRLTWRRGAS